MDINNCYACGEPIPELKIRNEEYSFCCNKCKCSTKWRKVLFEAQLDWNNGIIYCDDNDTFWKMMRL